MAPQPTVVTLNTEWEETRLQRFAADPFADELAADVLAGIRSDPDGVLLSLVRLAQGGDALAGRTVVQALLGKLVRMAVADRRVTVDDLLAALWVRLAAYPCERRPTKVAANLVLDARKDVLADQRGLRPVPTPEPAGDAPTAEAVLDAAVELGLIDQRSRQILGSVYADGLGSAAAAARHQTTATAVRWRCSRDVRRLAARAEDLWPGAA